MFAASIKNSQTIIIAAAIYSIPRFVMILHSIAAIANCNSIIASHDAVAKRSNCKIDVFIPIIKFINLIIFISYNLSVAVIQNKVPFYHQIFVLVHMETFLYNIYSFQTYNRIYHY